MDINCTDNCLHQQNGKCGLRETPESFASHLQNNVAQTSSCVFFIEKQHSPIKNE